MSATELQSLVQLLGIGAAALAFIVSNMSDIFSVDRTHVSEPGGGPAVWVVRFTGRGADLLRQLIMVLVALIAIVGTVLATATFAALICQGLFTFAALSKMYSLAMIVVYTVIFWIALLLMLLRWKLRTRMGRE
jgi:hypothetical protein